MKTKHFSLEERVVEPFHAIRWVFITRTTAIGSILALLLFYFGWWHFHEQVFLLWKSILQIFVNAIGASWTIQDGFWPDTTNAFLTLPKLNVPLLPPDVLTWWSFALGTIGIWIGVGFFKMSLLPIRTFTRFMMFLVWVSLACFAIAPLQFHHTIDEWSKVFFLSAYFTVFIYTAIWTFGVLWLPIPLRVKLFVSALLTGYLLVGPPVLFFVSVLFLVHSSIILLPLLALAITPLLQLGWFVSFYSIALSSGPDGLAEQEATT
jgi:hypothetical protein